MKIRNKRPLRLGSIAPDFTAETTMGRIDFHDYLGEESWAILFSYPADFTPVCTTELQTVARLQDQLERRNVKLVGLLANDLDSLGGWIQDVHDMVDEEDDEEAGKGSGQSKERDDGGQNGQDDIVVDDDDDDDDDEEEEDMEGKDQAVSSMLQVDDDETPISPSTMSASSFTSFTSSRSLAKKNRNKNRRSQERVRVRFPIIADPTRQISQLYDMLDSCLPSPLTASSSPPSSSSPSSRTPKGRVGSFDTYLDFATHPYYTAKPTSTTAPFTATNNNHSPVDPTQRTLFPLTVRSVFILDPRKIIRFILTYPASTGRNFDEILRVVDSLQLGDLEKITTPADWNPGGEVIVHPALTDEEADVLFPGGYRVVKSYLRFTNVS